MRRSGRGVLVIVCLVGFAAICGCSTTGEVAGKSASSSPYLIVEDYVLASQVSVTGVSHQLLGDLMQAHVTLKSNRERSLRILYRFQWYDATGIEIAPGAKPYNELILEGLESKGVTSIAPSPSAVAFKVKVRKMKVFTARNLWW
jgi:uncharacterized protein YcfL